MRQVMQSFRITETEAQAIKQRAERDRVSASELLRQALAAYLAPSVKTPKKHKRNECTFPGPHQPPEAQA